MSIRKKKILISLGIVIFGLLLLVIYTLLSFKFLPLLVHAKTARIAIIAAVAVSIVVVNHRLYD